MLTQVETGEDQAKLANGGTTGEMDERTKNKNA